MQLSPKILSGMSNSVDSDQTAPSDPGLHCLHMPLCQTLWCMEFEDIHHKPIFHAAFPVNKHVNTFFFL